MKKTMVIAILFFLVGVGLAHAQTTIFSGKLLNADRTGPMMATNTAQNGRILTTTIEQIGGELAHVDVALDTSTGDARPVSIDMYNRYDQHILSCPDPVVIGTHSTSKANPYTETFKITAICTFTPDGDGGVQGIGYLTVNGTSTRQQNVQLPLKFTVTGTLGVGVNALDNNFVGKGTFGSVQKPLVP